MERALPQTSCPSFGSSENGIPAGRKLGAGFVKSFPAGRKLRQNSLDNIAGLVLPLALSVVGSPLVSRRQSQKGIFHVSGPKTGMAKHDGAGSERLARARAIDG